MSTPTGDNSSLRDLERTVEEELALAERSEPEREALDTPIEDWLFDPADVEREEVALRSLLAAQTRRLWCRSRAGLARTCPSAPAVTLCTTPFAEGEGKGEAEGGGRSYESISKGEGAGQRDI